MTPQDILVRPLVTERATSVAERYNQVSFEVHKEANKHQIKGAVESIYGVVVDGVRTMVVPGKRKRRGTNEIKFGNWKKAIVSLADGSTIDFFANE